MIGLTPIDQRGMIHRLIVIGIPHDTIKPFINLVDKWVKCSGVEWTVKRLKSLKVDFIRLRAGLPPKSRIRKNSHGELYGPLGRLFRWGVGAKRFNKVLQALMAYTHFTAPRLTEAQRSKFLSAVGSEDPVYLDPSLITALHSAVRKFIGLQQVGFHDDLGSKLITYRGSPSKRAPSWGSKSVPQDRQLDSELSYLRSTDGLRLYSYFKDVYDNTFSGIERLRSALMRDMIGVRGAYLDPSAHIAGDVHFLQEPGYKLRSIASPFRIHQIALNPLGKTVYSIVRKLPWDCTFNQDRALPHIQDALARGQTVHSVDLTSATDYFPLEVQSLVLSSIFGSESRDVKLFEYLSRCSWRSKIGPVSWKRGQPLGLYPSFGVFTMTHGLLLASLAGNYHDQFFVVGDDVVILDDHLFANYIQMLQALGCPWSEDKSISSSAVSEFAGKVVTSTEVFPMYKWREMSDDNFLDISRNLGRRSRSLLSPAQREVFDILEHCLPPIGLGFSSKGSTYASMLSETERVLLERQKLALGSLVGLRPTIVMNTTNDGVANELQSLFLESHPGMGVNNLIRTFDEKVVSAFRGSLFSGAVEDDVSFAGLVSDMPEASRGAKLPLEIREPSRLTTLDRLRRDLGLITR